MSNVPKIVVVMAAYNRENLIQTGIESFLRQNYENKELLICDDCSTDDTWKVISDYSARHPEIKIFRNEVNKGFIRTINWLFSVAECDFISICDSDDWMADNKLQHQLALLHQYNVDCVISEYIGVRSDGTQKAFAPRHKEPTILQLDKHDVYFPAGSLFSKVEVIKKLKGFNEYFADAFCGDIYLFHLIAEKYKILYDPTHVYFYRMHSDSMTQSFDLKKLVKLELVWLLVKQRLKTGSDMLQEGQYDLLEKEGGLIMKNKKWLSRQYRIYGSRYIDENKLTEAGRFIKKAISLDPFSLLNYRTLIYFFKKRYASPSAKLVD